MRIDVIQRDIKGGCGSAWSCPLARAIGRVLGGEAAVTAERVLVSIPGSPYLVSRLPPKARRWVILYDHDKLRQKRKRPALRPISFELPDPVPLRS